MRAFLLTLTLATLALPASAALTYQFQVSPDTGAMQPFSFSFQSNSFLDAGDPITFSPFSITDGTKSYLIEKSASVSESSFGHCFLFATSGETLMNGPNTQCGLAFPGVGQASMWFYSSDPVLPAATGTFTYYGAIYNEPANNTSEDFDTTLTISGAPVPEPAALTVVPAALAALALVRRWRVS